MTSFTSVILQLFWTYFKIGTFTLGGGYAMLPLIQREVVTRHHWLDDEEFVNMIALAQAAPGLIAVNNAVFIGHRLAGWRGVLAAVLGAVLPSIICILLVAVFFTRIKDNPTIEAIFKGIRPAVVALIAAAVVRMGVKAFK